MNLQGDEGLVPARGGVPVITPGIEDVWPDVERRLRALLYRRGLEQASADDVVQEVALRVLAHGVTFDSAEDLLRWAAPVACRLHVDLLRHRARMTDAEEAPDHASRVDVAGEVADRLELQRAWRAIASLRPADRDAIIEAVADEAPIARSRQEAVRLAVRRHRARSRLAVVLEQLAAFGGVLAGWRVLVRQRRASLAALVPAAAAIPLMVTLAPSVTPPSAANPPAAIAPVQVAVVPEEVVNVSRRTASPVVARPAAPPVRRAPRVARVEADPKPAPQKVEVDTGAGFGVTATRDQRRADDHFLCLYEVPRVDQVCVL